MYGSEGERARERRTGEGKRERYAYGGWFSSAEI